ncbi:T9SS type A sorting domain-containing protein [Cellulophaga sp. Hel_I_12]|uniref:T9SS type A sorting domain-containing protein n=1 Tax=Cellulophaga sp. Hel_I_12 TaxID=1249972 RepID=UPI0006459D6F|nr:T9SS type A sorting domain-containing protein [Cellulophaga sp. Hel_I_12]
MKKVILTSFLLLQIIISYSQDKLAFKYDTAGNQISRQRVCLNCTAALKTKLPQSDSIPLIAENPEEIIIEFKLKSYPNPVVDDLYLEWINNPEKLVSRIQLFTLDNRLLINLEVTENQGEQVISFSNYPVGVYLVSVYYNDKTKKSIKIIKK